MLFMFVSTMVGMVPHRCRDFVVPIAHHSTTSKDKSKHRFLDNPVKYVFSFKGFMHVVTRINLVSDDLLYHTTKLR